MKRAALAILLSAAALRAQEEPTPFWLPPATAPARPEKKKRERVKPPKTKRKAPALAPAAPRKAEPPAQEERATVSSGTSPLIAEPPTPPQVQAQPAEPAPVLPSPPTVSAPIAAERPPLPAPSRDLRSVSFHALLGAWAKSRSDGSGRFWDVAWGVRAGYALLEGRLEADLQAVRAGGTAGNPFVNTSATHNLIALRAFWVLGDRYALLLGGGGGVALAQTHYALQDVGGVTSSNLDAIAVKAVMEITAAARARVFRGLEARGEVSTLLRDGRIEILPIFGLGAAF